MYRFYIVGETGETRLTGTHEDWGECYREAMSKANESDIELIISDESTMKMVGWYPLAGYMEWREKNFKPWF